MKITLRQYMLFTYVIAIIMTVAVATVELRGYGDTYLLFSVFVIWVLIRVGDRTNQLLQTAGP